MIIYGSIILVIIAVAVLKYFFHKELVWWKLLIMIVAPVLLSVVIKALIEYKAVTFTEYWGSEVISIYEQEPYNYWKVETCSHKIPCGTDSYGNTIYCTEYYDCSYQVNVEPEWWCETNIGQKIYISEAQYDKWMKQFGGNRIIVEIKKNYDANYECVGSVGSKFEGKEVGDYSYVYRVDWDNDFKSSIPVTCTHSYENRIRASDYTVFNYMKITEEQVAKYKLFDYPDFSNDYFTYPSILGGGDSYAQNLINKVNGHLGPKKEVRVWILLFNTNDADAGWMQENYWLGGNKNELVINIGIDSITNKINWCHVFTWSNSKGLVEKIEKFITKQNILNKTTWDLLSEFLLINIDKDWVRLKFSQFDYLTVDPPIWVIVLTYFLTIVLCCLLGYIFIFNDYYNEN